MDLQPVALAIQAASFVTGAVALSISAYNTLASRRINEVETLLKLTQDFSAYSAPVKTITADTPPHVSRRAFLDMANYIENLSSIYRQGFGTRLIRENIRGLVSDHVAASNLELAGTKIVYADLLVRAGVDASSFSDTLWFIETHRRLIGSKMARLES